MLPLRLRAAAQRPLITAGVTFLLALFWWLAVSASLEKSTTVDELAHLVSGFAYDRFGDFRMQPENGNLPQRIFGLPAVASGARFPMDEARWRESGFWQLGWDFLYGLNNQTDWIVLCARSLNALFGVALGALIFVAARQCYGAGGGLLSLAFYVLAPNFLAHAAFATSDLAGTFFLTLAPWLFWRHLRRRDLSSGLLSGAASGLALVAKFNAVLLAPIYFFLLVLEPWLTSTPTSASTFHARRLAINFSLALGQAALGVLMIWAFFNFRFAARAPGMVELQRFAWTWTEVLGSMGWKRPIVEWALHWRLLPEGWIYGMAFVLMASGSRAAFFAGEHSYLGWWEFFPALFLTKTSLAMLSGLGVAGGFGFVRFTKNHAAARDWFQKAAPFVVTMLVVWASALTSHLNIGDRHILAVYPAAFLILGGLASRRALAWVGVLLLVGHAYASFTIRPHYLAAFNRLAGGPERAGELFADSSIDWGQDLPGLQRWLARNRRPGEKTFLAYFGTAWPPHYGVRPDFFLPSPIYLARPPLTDYPLEPGIYCVSVTLLTEVYSAYRGPWQESYERRYRELAHGAAKADYAEFDQLRFSRLCKFLQHHPPEANVGYSILIFRLTADDLHAALEGPVTATHRLRLP